MNPNFFKLLLNVYPPYWGTGIVVKKISPDYKEIIVQMKMRWYNRNYVKTHFGGSLYAMTDPFFMLMLLQILGKEYIVWDKAAHIEFIRPGRGTLTAKFIITDEEIGNILKNTADGQKYLPEFSVNIKDEADETVASVTKILYLRKKINSDS
ncbi:MAG: tetrameric acyl-CoA thioesterase [Desulfobacteraceae bacterium IS3]|nr:MAG: tetrameric acyl-CoA thioesterase [Desulfobacteraceae bacterium IS3]